MHLYGFSAFVISHLVEALAPQVTHGLLDTLGQGLSAPLNYHLQGNSKHISVLVVSNLDPLHELRDSPVRHTSMFFSFLSKCTTIKSTTNK